MTRESPSIIHLLSGGNNFVLDNNVDTLHATMTQGLEFLHLLYSKGPGHSTLNTARSALSTMISPVNGIVFREQPLAGSFP